jgi:hypothetical protein
MATVERKHKRLGCGGLYLRGGLAPMIGISRYKRDR